jgi:CRISPR system Cascade subunit CasD
MPSFLVFRLYGPMSAWGDIAVGECRPIQDHPSKSGILGLVAAAIGVRRSETEKLSRLHDAYGFASMVDAPGELLSDYHTVQVPPCSKGNDFPTRRAELGFRRDELKTILTYRSYRCDAVATACIWPAVDSAPYELDFIKKKLLMPEFALYLGRRSCPLALPLQPQVLSDAGSPTEALKQARFKDTALLEPLLPARRRRMFYWESDQGGMEAQQTIRRRDVAKDRHQWQFAERDEHVAIEEVPAHESQ